MIDARIGRGILTSFHSKYRFFRIPLDLLYHSPDIFIDKLFIYPSVGSDHFPVGCSFYLDELSNAQEDEVKDLEPTEAKEVTELIQEGVHEDSDNR